MRPIPHRTEEADEEDGAADDPDESLSSEEAMAGEEIWLKIQEF